MIKIVDNCRKISYNFIAALIVTKAVEIAKIRFLLRLGVLLSAASALTVLALPQAGHAAFSNDKNNPTVLPWSEILSIAGTMS